ncbi:MAG TPA: sensor histidine kinase [Pilimelia sp.]|nr:sensor histidine kinase [Pilimelia sp.]
MTTAPAQAVPAPATAPMRSVVQQLLIDSRYVLTAFPLAIASFVVLLAGTVIGASSLFIVGLPILAGTLYVARAFADIERLSIPGVTHRARIRPHYRRPEPGGNWLRNILTPITQPQLWIDLAHGIFKFPLAIFTFVVMVVWWVGGVGGVLYWMYDWAIPNPPENTGLHEMLGLPDTAAARIGFNTSVGLFFLFTLPLVVRGCALLQASLAQAMLTGFAEMRDRITVLEEQRAAAVSAEATALRRLERDIHDGPQQRLVRLAMDLGRARQQLDNDPSAARRTLDEALSQTRETLAELRALSRGIAPPILVDRGLPSALAALAGRSTVPVELAVDAVLGSTEGRLEPAVENAAYFVVAEALTNVAKHSGASECTLMVARAGRRLTIVVRDNGVGGAHVAKGHGLAGLADRVLAIGGTLTVTSPAGGPTEVHADLPC